MWSPVPIRNKAPGLADFPGRAPRVSRYRSSAMWAGYTKLETALKYLHVNESEMVKMLANEKANEKKVVSLDEYRKAS
jgi:hypothetical protein